MKLWASKADWSGALPDQSIIVEGAILCLDPGSLRGMTAMDAIPKQSFGLESAYEISNADGGDKEMVVFRYGI